MRSYDELVSHPCPCSVPVSQSYIQSMVQPVEVPVHSTIQPVIIPKLVDVPVPQLFSAPVELPYAVAVR